MALNRDGVRLAKREGAVTLADLARLGMDADRVLAELARSLGLAQVGEPVTLRQLLERFDPLQLPRQPWVVDPSDYSDAEVNRMSIT